MVENPWDLPDDNRTPEVVRKARERLFNVERRLAGKRLKPSDSLARLLRVVEQLSAELDVDHVLKVAGQQIIDVFEAERVFIVALEPEGALRFRLAVSFQGTGVPSPEDEVSHAVIREAAEQRKPILVADARQDDRFDRFSSVRRLDLHSVMVAPLLARDELLGVLYADNREFAGVFDEECLNLLALLANHIAIALRNAQLFRDLDAARGELALSERFKAMGETAAFMAHQIKNPLHSIGLLVDVLRERWAEDVVRQRAFDVIPAEVARLNQTVNRTLDYARPTALHKASLRVTDLIDTALKALAPALEEAGVRVKRAFAPDAPSILGDRERLMEVFVNLIKNAGEAMAESDVRELRVRVARADGGRVRIVVDDTGPGISEDRLGSLFDLFQSSKKSGSGVGLPFCQKYVREHGGTIAVENRKPHGARFTIALPIRGM